MVPGSVSPLFVSEFPRPPVLVPVREQVLVRALGELLAASDHALQVRETFHPPTYYLPPEAFRRDLLVPAGGRSFCEWKGIATYCDVGRGPDALRRAVWSYPDPTPPFAALRGWFAVYPALMDGCWVDGEPVVPQPGGFYGGWITSKVVGPFKGDPAHPEII